MADILEGLHYRLLFSSLLAVIIICDSVARGKITGIPSFFHVKKSKFCRLDVC